MKWRFAALVPALLVGLAACGSGSVSAAAQPSAETGADRTFALFPGTVPAQGWEINTAARLGDTSSQDLLDETPDLAWSAEYEDLRDESEDDPYIKVYGLDHALSPDSVSVSEEVTPTQGLVAGHPAVWGTDTTDPEGETFVALSLTPGHTIELHAYNVSVDELRRYAGTMQPASRAEWVAAHRSADVH